MIFYFESGYVVESENIDVLISKGFKNIKVIHVDKALKLRKLK